MLSTHKLSQHIRKSSLLLFHRDYFHSYFRSMFSYDFLGKLFLLFVGLQWRLERLAVSGDSIEIVSWRVFLPVSQVPAQLGLHLYVYSPHVELVYYLPEIGNSKGLHQSFPQIHVCCQSREQYFEKMGTDAGVISSGILLSQLEVFKGQPVQIDDLPAKKRRVFQKSLGAHDTVDMRLGQAAIYILHEVDSPVGDHWNGEGLLDAADDGPVAFAHLVLVLLLGPSVHRQQLAACPLDALDEIHSGFLGPDPPDLAEDGDLHVFRKGSHDAFDQLRLLKQEGPIMASLGNPLRTSEVNVNGIHLLLQHLGSLDHHVRVVAAYLRHQRVILGAGGEVDGLVSLLRGHHLGVQHGGVGQVAAVPAGEQSEGQFRLVHHRPADHRWPLDEAESLLTVVDFHARNKLIYIGTRLSFLYQREVHRIKAGKGRCPFLQPHRSILSYWRSFWQGGRLLWHLGK